MLVRPVISRRRSLLQIASAFGASALALSPTGCFVLLGEQDAETRFLVVPRSDLTFWGWSEITVGVDTSSVESATLLAVSIDVDQPPGTPDLSFLSTVKAEAVNDAGRTTIATKNEFPPEEHSVVMNIDYGGNLKPLFKNEDTIRIEWTGSVNPAFTAWPEGGFWIRVQIKINVE